MADVLIYGDSIRSPELRHEVPVPIPDPFLYAETGDRRVVVLHSLEIPRVRADAPGLEIEGDAAQCVYARFLFAQIALDRLATKTDAPVHTLDPRSVATGASSAARRAGT